MGAFKVFSTLRGDCDFALLAITNFIFTLDNGRCFPIVFNKLLSDNASADLMIRFESMLIRIGETLVSREFLASRLLDVLNKFCSGT